MLASTRARKVLILALAGVAVGALLLLAAGLSGVKFAPPNRLVQSGKGSPNRETGLIFDVAPLWKGLKWAFLVLIPVSIVAAIIWPKSFLYLLIRTLVLLLFTLIFFFALRVLKDFIQPFLDAFQTMGPEEATSIGRGAEEGLQVSPVHIPRWAVFLFLLGGLALLALFGWWLRQLWLGGHRRDSLSEFSAVAGAAAEDLESGGDLKNVVLRCYREMSRLLSELQGVPFGEAMTAREFERQLRQVGVRDSHVAQLSRLFEQVRYGGRGGDPREERQALDCLRAVERAYGQREALA